MLAIYLLIVAVALVGLTITIDIYRKKHEKKPLVCPFNASCDTVITGDFSSFMGIGLEIYGAMYYGFIAISYSALIVFPSLSNDILLAIMNALTIAAFLFSLYLTILQAFVIKKWCSWCLMSAGISTSIFVFAMIGISISDFSFIPLFSEYKSYFTLLHLLGFALGVGGATVSDVLFLRFLKDFKISKEEKDILEIMSQIVWFGLMVIILSGIALFLPESERLLDSGKFLTKMTIIGILVLNGVILNLVITPKLLTIDWRGTGLNVTKVSRMSNVAFAAGAVSFVSWYTAFILGFARNVSFSYSQLISAYLVVILFAVIGSQIFKKILLRSKKEKDTSTIYH